MKITYDVLILGTGIAGLSTAIKLAEAGKSIGIVTRASDPNDTNTYWAQGGIVYSDENKDSVDSLVSDILTASSQTSSVETAKYLAKRSGEIVEELLLKKAKTDFERDGEGALCYTMEAAHSKERILYQGDLTGKVIQTSLLNYLKDKERFPNVDILCSHTAIDLITALHHGKSFHQRYEDYKILGAYLFDQKSETVKTVLSRATVLATGGIGSIYLHHTNSDGARGDGHAMAKRAGARVLNMEFIQFHPTTFYDRSGHRRFLISEALRGEGGILINESGEPFMQKYDERGELAPRDVVARSIVSEMISDNSDCVYLDITQKDPEWLKQRFPTIYAHCLKKRIDITKDPIPVVPAAHYTCGGVWTDVNGKTSVDGLYAVGEVACNGLHGANRLASTSLLEGLTFGYSTAEHLIASWESLTEYRNPDEIKDWSVATGKCDLALVAQDWLSLKQSMWNYVGITRSVNRLKRARAMFAEMNRQIGRFYKYAKLHDELIGLRNAVEVAFMVINSSMRSKESVGSFYITQSDEL